MTNGAICQEENTVNEVERQEDEKVRIREG